MQVNSRLSSVRVGLISTEPIRVAGLCSAFDSHPFVEVALGDLDTLLEDASLHFLILDLSSEPKWFDVLDMVRKMRPDIRQVIIGPPGDDEQILRSIRAGVRAFLNPSAGPLALRQAVEAVIQGTIWAPRRLLSAMIDQLMNAPAGPALPATTPTFSPRERQVLDLIMTACSNREIAEQLGIEERTVKAYVTSLMRKTGVDNRVSLSVRATRNPKWDARGLPSSP
jgi:DNA-binding NarL/FixJ family response regulator